MKKFLIAFGLIWIFLWCVFGLYLGAVQHDPYVEKMGSFANEGNFSEFWNAQFWWSSQSSAHAHALCYSFILIIIALVLPEMKYSEKMKKVIGILLTIGVILASVCGWLAIKALMAMGAFLIIASVLMGFIGIIQGSKE